MNNYSNSIVRLVPYYQSRFPKLFFPELKPPIYLASVPGSVLPVETSIFIIADHCLDGLTLSDEKEFFWSLKQLVINDIFNEGVPTLVLGKQQHLSKFERELDLDPERLTFELFPFERTKLFNPVSCVVRIEPEESYLVPTWDRTYIRAQN